MFEEPIRIGLIRFADLYDHHRASSNELPATTIGLNGDSMGEEEEHEEEATDWQHRQQVATTTKDQISLQLERKRALEFDSSHQPILVIYTTAS